MLKVPDGTLRCIVAGGPVFAIDEFVATEPYLAATYHELPEVTVETEELVAMQRNLARSSRSCSAICRKRRARWRWKSTTSPTRTC